MLPLFHRFPLRSHQSFFRKAHKVRGITLQLYWEKNDGVSRAAIIVPAQLEKLATKRNRLKRILRSALLPLLLKHTNLDVVLVVHSRDEKKLLLELHTIFQSIGL